MADDKDVIVITKKNIKDLVNSCGIACAICESTMSLKRGRAFQICDDCLKDLREIIKERRLEKEKAEFKLKMREYEIERRR